MNGGDRVLKLLVMKIFGIRSPSHELYKEGKQVEKMLAAVGDYMEQERKKKQ